MRLTAPLAVAGLAAIVAIGAAAAEPSLFRPAGPAATTPPGNEFVRWIAAIQANFYTVLVDALGAFRNAPHAGPWLIAASFAYGLFHAVGPGHGKAVLGSYMLASGAAARRGILLALGASFIQGLSALILVVVLAGVLNATGAAIGDGVWTLERFSFAVLTLFGLWLIWQKGVRPILAERRHFEVRQDQHHHPGHSACGCGHEHVPDADAMRKPVAWPQALGIMASIGVRPCSGAVIVLVFAMSQNLIWAGALSVFAISLGTAFVVSAIVVFAALGREMVLKLSNGDGSGSSAVVRWIERVGALLVFSFGLVLFLGSFGPRPDLF